jgi:hypothetical protein
MLAIVAIAGLLFLPIYLYQNTLETYLLAGFIFTEALIFIISQLLQSTEKNKANIQEHIKNLFQELDKEKSVSPFPSINAWKSSLFNYKYKKQVRQHLLTAHKEIYSTLKQTEDLQLDLNRLRSEIYDELEKKITNEATRLGINWAPYNPVGIIENSLKTPIFEVRINAQQKYSVWFGSAECSEPLADKQTAEDWASKLNIIAEEESGKIKNSQIISRRITEAERDFERLFNNLVSHILLGGIIDFKNEACCDCLDFHTKKDINRLKLEIAKEHTEEQGTHVAVVVER